MIDTHTHIYFREEFHVDEGKCIALAEEAGKLGIELFVVDDGW